MFSLRDSPIEETGPDPLAETLCFFRINSSNAFYKKQTKRKKTKAKKELAICMMGTSGAHTCTGHETNKELTLVLKVKKRNQSVTCV